MVREELAIQGKRKGKRLAQGRGIQLLGVQKTHPASLKIKLEAIVLQAIHGKDPMMGWPTSFDSCLKSTVAHNEPVFSRVLPK